MSCNLTQVHHTLLHLMARPYPLDPEGPLPARLPAELLARALERCNHPTANLIRRLGAHQGRTNAESLRRALDNPRARKKLQSFDESDNLIANALYRQLMRAGGAARQLDKDVFQAACVERDGKRFLDIDRFRHVITNIEGRELACDEFCFMVLAFSILQPESAEDIVAIASEASPNVGRFFELDVGLAVQPQSIERFAPAVHLRGVPDLVPETTARAALPTNNQLELAPQSLTSPVTGGEPTFNTEAALRELPTEQHTSLVDFRRALEQYAETSARVQYASQNGAWDELPGLVEHVKAIEREARAIHERLERALAPVALPWEPIPPSNREVALARCDTMAAALQNARKQQALRIEVERRKLIDVFEGVGMTAPDTLISATSLDVIRFIAEAAADELRIAHALKLFIGTFESSPSVLEGYAPPTRMEVYFRAARHPQADLSTHAIEWLMDDPAAAAVDVSRALELIVSGALTRLARNAALPFGTWEMFSRLASDTWITRLIESELLGRLVVSPIDAIDIDGLVVTLMPYIQRAEIPDELRRLVQREAAKSLPFPGRVALLSGLAKDQPSDCAVLQDLLDVLAGAGRCAEAFLLAVAATRAGFIDALPSTAHDAVRAILIDTATKGTPQARDLARLLVGDPEWLMTDADGATLILFASWALGIDELYHRVRYQWSELFAQAAEFRPVLITELLVPYLEGRDPVAADKQLRAAQTKAAELLANFRYELQRHTFFNSWDYAKGYMALIKEHLTNDFNRLESGRNVEPLTPDAIKRLASQAGLPPINNHRASESMETYMREQWSRLSALAGIRAELGQDRNWSFGDVAPPLSNRLAAEADLPGNDLASIRRIYEHVMEEV